jgi:hypothetical protein
MALVWVAVVRFVAVRMTMMMQASWHIGYSGLLLHFEPDADAPLPPTQKTSSESFSNQGSAYPAGRLRRCGDESVGESLSLCTFRMHFLGLTTPSSLTIEAAESV